MVKGIRLLIVGWVAGGLTLVVRAADPEIRFVAVLTSPEIRVALLSKGAPIPEFVFIGSMYAGFTVESYDAKQDVVVLSKDGRLLRLPMTEYIYRADLELPAKTKIAILINLRDLSRWADIYYLENGKKTATLADLVGPKRKVKGFVSLEPKAGEDYSRIIFEQGKPLSVTTADGTAVTYQP